MSTNVDLNTVKAVYNGAGMRFLARCRDVAKMTGVDATETVVARGRERCAAEGLGDRIEFVHADVCNSGLANGHAGFVWGQYASRAAMSSTRRSSSRKPRAS
jgi:hypothetical protein